MQHLSERRFLFVFKRNIEIEEAVCLPPAPSSWKFHSGGMLPCRNTSKLISDLNKNFNVIHRMFPVVCEGKFCGIGDDIFGDAQHTRGIGENECSGFQYRHFDRSFMILEKEFMSRAQVGDDGCFQFNGREFDMSLFGKTVINPLISIVIHVIRRNIIIEDLAVKPNHVGIGKQPAVIIERDDIVQKQP